MEYEDRITIPTPEGVSLEMTLAGLGSRIVAGGVDLVLKAILVVPVLIVLVALFNDLAYAVAIPLTGLLMIGYDVAFETLAGGRTPGKRWSGLRVVRSSGRPVDLLASAIRNVLRLVDGLPLSYVPTFISILVTKRNQRPGDLAADTVVIRDRRGVDRVKPTQAPSALVAGAGATWDVSAIPADEVATVRAFLERREGLTKDARVRVAKRLDGALRPRVAGADEWAPERVLEILYEVKQARG
jgi:uncharacterized RDD family membrane protein YckC